MTTTTDNPRTTIPRSAGTWRKIGRIQVGWWVHLEETDGAPEGTGDAWSQVRMILDYTVPAGVRALVFDEVDEDGGNTIRAYKSDDAVTLTAREAAKLGLVEVSR
jgi:hypothetical protein